MTFTDCRRCLGMTICLVTFLALLPRFPSIMDTLSPSVRVRFQSTAHTSFHITLWTSESSVILLFICTFGLVALFFFAFWWRRRQLQRQHWESLLNDFELIHYDSIETGRTAFWPTRNAILALMLQQRGDSRSRGIVDESNGLHQTDIDRLPTRSFHRSAAEESLEEDMSPSHSPTNNSFHRSCAICLMRFAENDTLRTLPCLHYFHSQCVDQWLAKKQTCPICKFRIDLTTATAMTTA